VSGRRKLWAFAGIAGALIPLLCCSGGFLLHAPDVFAAQTSTQHKAPKGRVAPEPVAPPEVAMPFRVGEKLDYRIAWATFSNAATLELNVPERRDLLGWHTWHFQADFHTDHTVRSLFAIDDQFDSYTDTSSLEARQFEMYLNELGKKQNSVLRFVARGQTSRAPGPFVIVLPGTRDPLGTLFALRSVDWQHMPQVIAPVYDGHDLYEMHAHIEAMSDSVQVDAGSFTASRVTITVFQNGKQDSAIQFVIWFANNAARTPVQVVATLPFGNLKVELTQAK
jgi:hypothetical protein